MAQEQSRIVSDEELISAYAKEMGLPPSLALAVARRESSMKREAVGDSDLPGGPSRGLFQLRPETAKDMGVDPSDPLQNIYGGVKYLKFLNDRYQGDVQKTLQAYNGGLGNVEAGKVSPAAQAYAAEVWADISREMRAGEPSAAPPAAQAAPGAAPVPAPASVAPKPAVSHQPAPGAVPGGSIQAAPGMGEELWRGAKAIGRDVVVPVAKALAQSMNPMTPEGRQNLAVTAGTTAVSYAFPPAVLLRAGVAPWLARVLMAPTTAAAVGAGETAVENLAGTSTENPLTAGVMQAAYELGGQAFVWPIRTMAKDLVAGRVGREARTALTGQLRTVRRGGQIAMDTMRSALRAGVESVRQAGESKVAAVKEMGESATRLASDTSAARLAALEVENAKTVADITAQYTKLEEAAPSVMATAGAAREALGGLPGLRNVPLGPAKRAIDIAGERVRAAAETGPMLDVRDIQSELGQMGSATIPRSILEREAKRKAELEGGKQVAQIERQLGRSITSLSPKQQQALIPGMDLLPEGHPLPKLLGEFQKEGQSSLARDGKIPFIELHKWKTLLDSAVNHDLASKDLVEQLTKGLREKIREKMAVHEPYNVATAAFAKIVPLYREGIGKELITAAAKDPDKVARTLNVREPENALAVRSLLVDQSAAGGDVAVGQRAWDAVRARWTYDNIIKGGVDGLADRVHRVVTENPEFARVVYGDPAAARVLTNVETIGNAIKQAEAAGAARVAQTKAIGKAGVEEAQMVASHATEQTAQAAREATRAQASSAAKVRQAARRQFADQREGLQEKLGNLAESSVGPYVSRRAGENVVANVARAALTPRSPFGQIGMLRILRGPRSDELLEWAAYSNQNTQRLVRVLLDPAWERGWAALLRDATSATMRPVASHSQEPQP